MTEEQLLDKLKPLPRSYNYAMIADIKEMDADSTARAIKRLQNKRPELHIKALPGTRGFFDVETTLKIVGNISNRRGRPPLKKD